MPTHLGLDGHHPTQTMLVECCPGLNPPTGALRWVKRLIEMCRLCLLPISLLRKRIVRHLRIRQAPKGERQSLTTFSATDYHWPAARCPRVVGRKMPDTAIREATQKKITLLLADDHPAFREGLSLILAEEDDFEIVAKVGDGWEAVKAAERFLPDVAIIDVAMPGLDGIQALKQIRMKSPKTAVIVLSAYDYESYVLPAVEAGAAAYLLKSALVDDVVSAIRSVHKGHSVFGAGASGKIAARLSETAGKTRELTNQRLHGRELEVLRLAAGGLTNKAIAAKLVISTRTVQAHFHNILRKLGATSRTEAVLRALREGWITFDSLS
jgi:NarL family two-component system response regulator LiaR